MPANRHLVTVDFYHERVYRHFPVLYRYHCRDTVNHVPLLVLEHQQLGNLRKSLPVQQHQLLAMQAQSRRQRRQYNSHR